MALAISILGTLTFANARQHPSVSLTFFIDSSTLAIRKVLGLAARYLRYCAAVKYHWVSPFHDSFPWVLSRPDPTLQASLLSFLFLLLPLITSLDRLLSQNLTRSHEPTQNHALATTSPNRPHLFPTLSTWNNAAHSHRAYIAS